MFVRSFTGDEPSTTTYGTEAGWVKPVDAAETAPSDAGDAASVEELDSGLPSFSIAFTPDTDEMGGDVWSDDGIVEADDGLYGSAQMDAGATQIALAAAGRNPTDITIPVAAGSEVSGSGAQGSHETGSQGWGAWLASKASSAAGYVSEAAASVASTVNNEIALLPGTVANLPWTIASTAMSGEMADSVAGAVDGGINAVVTPFGTRPLSRGSIFGNEQAFANGRIVGQGAVLAAETAVFVSGTMGLGAIALPAAGGEALGLSLVGGGQVAFAVGTTGSGAIIADSVLAGAGLYMAGNTAGNLGGLADEGGSAPSGGAGDGPNAAELEGEVSFGKNFDKKVRKHIDQVRNRCPVKEDIPSPGNGGIERVQEIIRQRVAQGGGRATTYAGEPAIAFEDGGVTYIFRRNGEFWTILGN